MKSSLTTSRVALIAILQLLAACGASNDSDTPVAATPDAFVAAVQVITATAPDNTEPANIDALVATAPEDVEPLNL